MITVRWPRADAAFPQVEFRRLFRQIRRPAADDAAMVTAYTDGVVTLRSNRRLDGYHEAADMSGMQGVKVGDFVVHGLDILRGSVGVSDADGAMSSVCVICAPIADVEPRYFAWQIRAQAASGLPRALARGVREGGADFRRWDTLAELPVLCPTRAVQRAIADYLDVETARIDALITKKQRMIKLLEERRSAFVGRAVTLGLDGGRVVSTESEFAPVVRDGWTLHRLRHVVAEIVDTAHKTAPVVDGGEYLVVRTANVKSGELVLEGAHYTDEAAWREWTARGVPAAGDVIFTREAPAGEACVVPEGQPLCIGQRTVLLRPNRSMIHGEWILHSIYSGAAQRFIEVLARSTTVAHINMSDIPDLPVVVPPLPEQEAVLMAVRCEVARVSELKGKLERQIGLLREHRQALITAAVTGELEVPGVAA